MVRKCWWKDRGPCGRFPRRGGRQQPHQTLIKGSRAGDDAFSRNFLLKEAKVIILEAEKSASLEYPGKLMWCNSTSRESAGTGGVQTPDPLTRSMGRILGTLGVSKVRRTSREFGGTGSDKGNQRHFKDCENHLFLGLDCPGILHSCDPFVFRT